VFERFTDRARRIVVLAQEEAFLLKHTYIGTEHILLGLLSEREGVAGRVLESLGISLDSVRHQVEQRVGRGTSAPQGHIPFTPRAKKVLELALREALQLGHNYIGTEHLLLGLIREGEGVASQVLGKLGADLDTVRRQVIQTLSAAAPAMGEALLSGPPTDPPNCPRCKASVRTNAQVMPLTLSTQENQEVHLLAIYCGKCGSHLSIVKA
jgi:ATP-dependent Clp protease ATP-binding subunit ClpC